MMPKHLWTSGDKVAQAIYQEWLTSGDIRTVNLRRKCGVGIYQASQRFHGSWWKSAAKGGVPKHALKNRASAVLAACARIRPGRSIRLPCRSCQGWNNFKVTNGSTVIACRQCSRPMMVSVTYEIDGWRIRTR